MQKKATALEGLYIIEDFITETEEQELIRAIDSRIWCGNGVAKVIQNLGPLPTFTDFIIKRFKQQKIIDFEDEPNMCIINEYEAGQAPRSLLIMTKSSRYDYKHSISKDIIEWFDGGENGEKQEIIRNRRVSLTFRTVRNPEADVAINS
ncbi:11615_t:CDS:2 [Dentiscutata erythropus]|uniref:11615_t:CDS:1 n=1 Tax=Dentiscutata erythropus TaxID=1348616 RepID=A0A9N9EC94_9GLOM|nr:11615_t:CDS:2 [Dentiscutata erythropus]